MKHLKYLHTSLLLIALLFASSCQKSENSLFDYVSEDDAILISINVANIMENAGFDISKGEITPPATFKRLISSNNEVIDVLTSIKGIDPRTVLVSVPSSSDLATAFVKVTNESDFAKALKNQGFEKSTSGDYTIYKNDGIAIVIDGDVAILLADDFEGTSVIDQLKQKSTSDPLPAWKMETLNQGHAMVALLNYSVIIEFYKNATGEALDLSATQAFFDDDIASSTMVMDLTLEGLKMCFSNHFCNADGSEIKTTLKLTAPDKSLLKYTNAADILVMLISVPLDQQIIEYTYTSLKPILGIDAVEAKNLLMLMSGKVEMSFGYSDVSSFSTGAGLVGSIALEAKDNNPKALFGYIKSLIIQGGIPYNTVSPTCLAFPIGVDNLYLMTDGDNVVMSLTDTFDQGGCEISASDFSDVPFETIIKIPARDSKKTLLPLPFALEIRLMSDASGAVFTATMTETEGYFLENILNAIP